LIQVVKQFSPYREVLTETTGPHPESAEYISQSVPSTFMLTKTLYYPTHAQIYNSQIKLELL